MHVCMYHSYLNGTNINDSEGKRGMTDKGVIGHRRWQLPVVPCPISKNRRSLSCLATPGTCVRSSDTRLLPAPEC
jgi:hypothetical protein